jgi:hypothetical protein
MKKVFMIAHQFAPMGDSGVQRTSKFVKYLPQFGYEPIIFTVNSKQKLIDQSLSSDIGENIEVIRTRPYDLENSFIGIIGKIIANKILIPDAMWLWYIMTRKRALEYVWRNNIRLIYSTSYPYSCHLIGLYIKRKLPYVKWVADFRDEWTNNPYILDKKYSLVRQRIEKKMERDVAMSCTRFIANTSLMLEAFVADNPIRKKSDVISNGFDADDFSGLNRKKPNNERMIITHLGSIYGRTKPDAFFEALAKGIKNGDINPQKVTTRIIGNYTETLVKRIKKICSYENVMEFMPYIPHEEGIQKLLESDILLFIIGIGKGTEKIYTGKIFEYLYANRPILAMVPDNSVVKNLLIATNTGTICSNENSSDIYSNLVNLYKEWKNDQISHKPNWNKIDEYNRVNLTKKLIRVFKCAMKEE